MSVSNEENIPINTAISTQDINHFIEDKIKTYEKYDLKDLDLWETYQEDFAEFTQEILTRTSRPTLQLLRKFLRVRGVYVTKKARYPVVRSLFEVIREEEPTEWTKDLIDDHLSSDGPFNSHRVNYLIETLEKSKISAPQLNLTSQLEPKSEDVENKQESNNSTPKHEYPARQVSQNPGDFSKELTALSKFYTEDAKYSGEDDNFDYKLAIFHDLCERSGVQTHMKSHAYPTMLRGLALDHYYANLASNKKTDFEHMCQATSQYFEGPEYKRKILARWNALNLKSVMELNSNKSARECLQILVKELRHLQHGLDPDLRTDKFLHNKLISACQKVPACQLACFKPSESIGGLINDLQSSIASYEELNGPINTQTFFTDRKYHSLKFNSSTSPTTSQSYNSFQDRTQNRPKKCFVCKRQGCWSSRHTQEERNKSVKEFKNGLNKRFDKNARHYIANLEGVEDSEDTSSTLDSDEMNDQIDNLILDVESLSEAQHVSENFLTSFGPIPNPEVIMSKLADKSFEHVITKSVPQNLFNPAICTQKSPNLFTCSSLPNRYDSRKFHGVMIDTGASKGSTAGYGQYLACKNVTHNVEIDESKAGAMKVQFGIGSTESIGSFLLDTPIGVIEFHVVHADTPLLLCLADMDKLKVYYNNIDDFLVSASGSKIKVVRQFGHPFLTWNETLSTLVTLSFDKNPCFLTEIELRKLHRRFGHPSCDRLYRLLKRAGHQPDRNVLHHLTKFCNHCQIHAKSPGRFKFTLREDLNFNYSIIVDIMYIDANPVIHIVDEGTRFQAARFLRNLTAKHTWDMIRSCWIDTYVGPPDYIIHDAGTNFTSKEFRQHASSMGVTASSVPVEAHWSIGIVERYHAVLRRCYQIILEEIGPEDKDLVLQMAVKAINDTAGPDGLVPTLLVFGAYPKMTEYDAPSPTIAQRSSAIIKAMKEVRKFRAERQVSDALRQRNGPITSAIYNLPLNSDVLVWREGKIGQNGKWTGPFKLLSVENETCKIDLPSGPTNFRVTAVKPFFKEPEYVETDAQSKDYHKENSPPQTNQDEANVDSNHIRKSSRVRIPTWKVRETSASALLQNSCFDQSRQKEINGLLEKGVFEIVEKSLVPQGARIFGCRFVDQIKNIGTDKAFEKSRLVVQAYNDNGKELILTQSPTIQRMSQRLILVIAAVLREKKKLEIYRRDISQAYLQSSTSLSRDFFVSPPSELKLNEKFVIKVIKPLYGIPEAGNHWYKTYHNHHTNNLNMSQSTYDPCLLSTHSNGFGVVGLQTDDTLILADENFASLENLKLQKANFLAKEREKLTDFNELKFNGFKIKMKNKCIVISQELQCENIRLINLTSESDTSSNSNRTKTSFRDQFVAQRARGAYIASVCQPEAAFDLSFSAQVIDPDEKDIKYLNKRLQWQIDNKLRGLRFVQLDINTLRLITFTDASFANNRDLSSQIGFVITLADGNNNANIIHWSSTKCERVTRSVLASELYAITHGFDVAAVLKTTIEQILDLEKPLPLILCTDSKSLYDCLVKLGTTQDKRLMVDLMCLRQSYERRQIHEIKWIEGKNNPADAMTKGQPCQALTNLIDSNTVNIEATGWVERSESP